MYNSFVDKEKCVYYCKKCDKIYKSCYVFGGVTICSVCWSEDVKIISETEIVAFIRNKKINKINKISEK